MSFYRDKQVQGYCIFLTAVCVLMVACGILSSRKQTACFKAAYLAHDAAIASSLLEQGVPQNVAASAINSLEVNEAGKNLLKMIGVTGETANCMLPFISEFQREALCSDFTAAAILTLLIFTGAVIFFEKRKRLYFAADEIICSYMAGDFSRRLPQNREGALFRLFSHIEQLSTMLGAKSEAEHNTKEFLKDTISDISHQLKTPLAALAMYQEIIEGEPENIDAVKNFAAKMGTALERMKSLIGSMLKLTRLDAGNIAFEKYCYDVSELVLRSINELTVRAERERKAIVTEGDPALKLVCDIEWTSEAIGNIVKNALDHTGPDGVIRISWEKSPAMLRIFISDNGNGIAPEDLHHIFKRFYRSRNSLDVQGTGLGLPLAKSIIEGQGGVISVQSSLNKGTTFTLSFLTEL